MSKSHPRSNREIRKPKQVKAKPAAAPASVVASLYRSGPGEGASNPKPPAGQHRPH